LAAHCLLVLVLCGCGKSSPPVVKLEGDEAAKNCALHLKLLDDTKHHWAQDAGKGPTDVPTWDDLAPYFRRGVPHCLGGGTYNLGPVSQPPTCSVAAHNEAYKKMMAEDAGGAPAPAQ